MISTRVASLAALLLVAGGTSLIRAQDNSATSSSSQPDSLGDAARKARAQKKEPAKPAKVFTNEDLGSLKGTISVIGNQPSTAQPEKVDDKKSGNPPDAKATNGADAKDIKKDEPKDESYWRGKFAAARKTLAADSKEVDILQRELNLKQEQYSQDPNWAMHEQYSRSDINKTQDEIDAKKQDVEKDKQALSDLEDDLRKAGGEPGWANEPSAPDSNGPK